MRDPLAEAVNDIRQFYRGHRVDHRIEVDWPSFWWNIAALAVTVALAVAI